MKIYGLDFTSAPSRRKPITCAGGVVLDDRLHLEELNAFTHFAEFDGFLNRPGPRVAGFDFPFGQPRKLVQNLGWPLSWEGYVRAVARLGKAGFEQTLAAYRQAHPPGEKQPLRATDLLANSRSPMMWYGVPVGKMFFEGAPRLLRAGVSIVPCHPTDDSRICIEVYPRLVVKKFLGQRSYKNDTHAKQTTVQAMARQEMVNALWSEQLQADYGFSVELSDKLMTTLTQDPSGDSLDAVLCAIQAAWAYRHNFAVPPVCDSLEGWIFDPELR